MSLQQYTTIGNAGGPLDTQYEMFFIELTGVVGTTVITLPDIVADGMHYKFKRKDVVSLRNCFIQGFNAAQTIDDGASVNVIVNLALFEIFSKDGKWKTTL
jgi:hypothetical protein